MRIMTRPPRNRTVLCLALAGLAACAGDSSGPSDGLLVVGGTVTNRSGQPIPSGAHLVIAWVVSSGPSDYTYVFGEGSVQGTSFSVVLRQSPPAATLNAGQLGVGVALLTTKSSVRSGVHLEDVVTDPADLIDTTGQFAVIYKQVEVVDVVDWAMAFLLGYGVGAGVQRPQEFDAFQPVAPTSMELIVDDLENIEFENWT